MDGSLRIAALFRHEHWVRKQSPARRHYVWAVSRRPDVRLRVVGPGMPGWDARRSTWSNLQAVVPDCQVVWGYKLGGLVDEETKKNCLIVESYNECWAGEPGYKGGMHAGGGTAAEEMIKAKLDVAIIHHANDRGRLAMAEEAGIEIDHIPHCASVQHFNTWGGRDRRSGVVLTGVVDERHYPLRVRWESLIRSGKISGVVVPRPPHRCSDVRESEKHVYAYATALKNASVKLGCSSRWRYALNHYVEAAASGCVQVADMPDAAPPGYENMIVPVSPEASDGELLAAVDKALDESEELGRRAQVASRVYTTSRYADDFVHMVRGRLK